MVRIKYSRVCIMTCTYLTTDSDILHFDILGTSVVVLNSYKAAKELLDYRSGIYSSRWAAHQPCHIFLDT
jgi:hypothetical protein